MKVKKLLAVAIVSIASLIVIVTVVVAVTFLGFSRGGSQQNFAPSQGQKAVSPLGNIALFSQNSGGSSFLYRKDSPNGKQERLTAAVDGIESEPSFSHNGELIVYSFATSPDSKSAVWEVGADGSNPHAITREDEDALHPIFSPDDSKILYAASKFTGHHSPIARPARHEWDVFSVSAQSAGKVAGASPLQVTHLSL